MTDRHTIEERRTESHREAEPITTQNQAAHPTIEVQAPIVRLRPALDPSDGDEPNSRAIGCCDR